MADRINQQTDDALGSSRSWDHPYGIAFITVPCSCPTLSTTAMTTSTLASSGGDSEERAFYVFVSLYYV